MFVISLSLSPQAGKSLVIANPASTPQTGEGDKVSPRELR